jgi:hypothetical protein
VKHNTRCSGARRFPNCGMASRPTAPACLTVLRPAVHVWRVRRIGVRLFTCLPERPNHPPKRRQPHGLERFDIGNCSVTVRDAVSANAGSRRRTGLWYVCASKQSSESSEIRRCCKVTTSTALCCAMPGWYGILPCGLRCYSTWSAGQDTRRKLPRHGFGVARH